MKKTGEHPFAPKPYDAEKVRRTLARLRDKTEGDDSGAEGLPLTPDPPVGSRVVVQFWKAREKPDLSGHESR